MEKTIKIGNDVSITLLNISEEYNNRDLYVRKIEVSHKNRIKYNLWYEDKFQFCLISVSKLEDINIDVSELFLESYNESDNWGYLDIWDLNDSYFGSDFSTKSYKIN